MSENSFDQIKSYNLKKVRPGVIKGLVNLGNSCYINSIIQCLNNCFILTDFFLNKEVVHEYENTKHVYNNQKDVALLKRYFTLLQKFWQQPKEKDFQFLSCNEKKGAKEQLKKYQTSSDTLPFPIKPFSFVNQVYDTLGYTKHEQEDSHEFLLKLLDSFHRCLAHKVKPSLKEKSQSTYSDDFKKLKYSSKKFYIEKFQNDYSSIVKLFYGLQYSKLTCSNERCSYKSQQFQEFNHLTLSIPDNKDYTLQELIKNCYNNQEVISNWKCSNQKCKSTTCTKENYLFELPAYLIIQISRFTISENGELFKNNNFIEYYLDDLPMKQYFPQEELSNWTYELTSINFHQGNLESGHYYSACKNLNNQWYIIDDADITSVNQHTLSQILNKNAYILFYTRKVKE